MEDLFEACLASSRIPLATETSLVRFRGAACVDGGLLQASHRSGHTVRVVEHALPLWLKSNCKALGHSPTPGHYLQARFVCSVMEARLLIAK